MKFISIDAESNGLAGRAFAVAMVESGMPNPRHAIYRCPVDVPTSGWVQTNVLPAIADVPVNCNNYAEMLNKIVETYEAWGGPAVPLVTHIPWPVEARLLLDVYGDPWEGPYPLIDVAPILASLRWDPLSVDNYLAANNLLAPSGSPHHPLYDAQATATCLRHLLEVGPTGGWAWPGE